MHLELATSDSTCHWKSKEQGEGIVIDAQRAFVARKEGHLTGAAAFGWRKVSQKK